jgi:crotonobetainyl-CoA:carnitine CoA-transferase CaiB-like acyl-CoA transferase
LPLDVCVRRLELLGAAVTRKPDGPGPAGEIGRVDIVGPGPSPLDHAVSAPGCGLSWYGPSGIEPDRPGSEAVVQALSGMMVLHGHDAGGPRRLGLEVASVAAGMLAAQGVLAASIARHRGMALRAETSVLQAALLPVSQHLAVATCGDRWSAPDGGPAPGPPFATSDGHLIELECLDPESWRAFWAEMGLDGPQVGRAWMSFVYRFEMSQCSLPRGFHEATAARPLAELVAVARRCRMSLCRVRDYDEVVAELGDDRRRPLEPLVRPTPSGGAASPLLRPARADDSRPLGGLRVVEATRLTLGPLVALLLQMLGAEVVRIEPPGGDWARAARPLAGDTNAPFLARNRGKTVVELDLGSEAGRAGLLELAAGADVFVHNWRPGKAAALTLDAAHVAGCSPALVYAAVSGWGPLDDPPTPVATDYVAQAHSGVAAGMRPVDEPPAPSRLITADVFGALVACEGILAALLLRERTGNGCRVDTSLLGGAMALQDHVLRAMAGGQEQGRLCGRPVWTSLDRPLETADGYLVVSVDSDPAMARFCAALHVGIGADRVAAERAIVELLGTRPARDWEAEMVAAGVPCAVVPTDLASLADDPRMSPLLERVDGAAMAASPWQFTLETHD